MAFVHALDGDGEAAGKVEVVGKARRETVRAMLFSDGSSEQWLRKPKIRTKPLGQGQIAIFMPRWLAKLKGYL